MQSIGFGRGVQKKNHGMGGGSPYAPPPLPPIWETLSEWVSRTLGIDVTLPSGISVIFNQ